MDIAFFSPQVLGDWNSGKIKYCTHPPEEERQTSSEIVTKFASEFSLNELEKGEKMDLQNLPLVRPSEMVNVEAGQINDKAADITEYDEEDMEAENDENALPANIEVFAKQGKRHERKMEKEKEDPLFKLEGNLHPRCLCHARAENQRTPRIEDMSRGDLSMFRKQTSVGS